MAPVDKGRFCSSCQKKVIDFSTMSDREISLFFKSHSGGSICGRFLEDQLNRNIEIPRKRIPWVKYFFHIAFPAFIVSLRAAAQHERLQPQVAMFDRPPLKKEKKAVDIENTPSRAIIGRVLDDNGNPLPYATILIKGTNKGVAADSLGNFILQPQLDWKSLPLSISSVGFVTFETTLARREAVDTLEVRLKAVLLGEVIVTKSYRTHITGAVSSVRMSRRNEEKIKKPSELNFRMYPNPVHSNSSLHIEGIQKEPGENVLEIFNQSGQLTYSKEISTDEGKGVFDINMPSLPAGSYFLKLTNKRTGNSFTEKLVIM